MENSKRLKIILSALGITLVGIGLTYAYQCLIFFMDSKGFSFRAFFVMLLLSGAPLILLDVLFALFSINVLQWKIKEVCEVLIVSSLFFGVLVFILFPAIPLPYALIPSGEMAMGFLQLLIGIFAAIPAAICFLASIIVLAMKKADENN